MSRYAAVHDYSKLGGPGDARPTAQAIIDDYSKRNALQDQTIIVTGVSTGIGTSTALALATTGATLFLAGRSIPKNKAALPTLVDNPNVHFLELDLASQASVKAFVAEFLKQSGGKLNILVNNAGVILAEHQLTEDGVETQFAVNHLSQFLLFSLLKPALLASASPSSPSRVVNLTSLGHRLGTVQFDNLNLEGDGVYNPGSGYGQAKTASIYTATEIERRYGSQHLHAWSLQPGAIIETAFLKNSGWDEDAINAVIAMTPPKVLKSIDQGAALQVWVAVSDDVLEPNWRGKYLENFEVARPVAEVENPDVEGHAAHAYDAEASQRLWTVGEELLGVKV